MDVNDHLGVVLGDLLQVEGRTAGVVAREVGVAVQVGADRLGGDLVGASLEPQR